MARFDRGEDYNPYAPPSASSELFGLEPTDELPLAAPSARLNARLLDGLLLAATAIPIIFVVDALGDGAMLLGFVPFSLCLYQWYLLTTLGQTLGKKWVGIRIVKLDGGSVNFVSGVLLRNWLMHFMTAIPGVGGLVAITNVLMIFGKERRCIHDHVAGTKVVLASGRYGSAR